jgi:exopolyphosphatase/guanosine-5'-triphosphate,3'-diphosphate pyrophosphatase
MIKSARLNGFSDAEREIIASVARYHGRKPPKKGHAWNKILSKKDKEKVRYLSAIIRVADALDRTHRAVVEDLRCLIDNDRIVLQLKSRSPADEELQSLARKKGYFEKLFGRTVETG